MRFLALAVAGIEWYDNALCFAMANIISSLFFPANDVNARFLLYLSSFIAGYLGRPLGAILFGWYSDKKSRAGAAYLSFFMMIFASFTISFLPTYKLMGNAAPLLFVFFRILQGIALGGNYAISVFSVEKAENNQRYFASSIINCGFIFGFLFGSLTASSINYFFTQEYIYQMAWRFPFWVAFFVSLPILFKFKNLKKEDHHEMPKVKNEKLKFKTIIKVFFLMTLDMIPFYIFFVFLPNYRTMFINDNPTIVWLQNSLSMIIMFFFTPLFGKIADKFGAIKSLKLVALSIILISFFSPWEHWVWSVVFGVIMSGCYGSLYALVAMIFPKNVRARASGVTFNIAAVVFGAGTPFIATLLAKYNFNFISIFLGLAGLIAFIILHFTKENIHEI